MADNDLGCKCFRFPNMPVCGCTVPCRKACASVVLKPILADMPLFVGPMEAAYRANVLRAHGITHVVDCSDEPYHKHRNIMYLSIPVRNWPRRRALRVVHALTGAKIQDRPDVDIAQYFPRVLAFIRSALLGLEDPFAAEVEGLRQRRRSSDVSAAQHGASVSAVLPGGVMLFGRRRSSLGPIKGGVLVHCKAGVSRSVSFVLAYLVKHMAMGLEEALQMVQRARGMPVEPNAGFMRQLQDFERIAVVEREEAIGTAPVAEGRTQEEANRRPCARGPVVSWEEIPLWSDRALLLQVRATSDLASVIALWRGDITRINTDAIVAAGNERLGGCRSPGHCIDAAIFLAAGEGLFAECAAIGGCPTGEARITSSHALPCKHIIHTVGPIYGAEQEELQAAQLASCYRNTLDLGIANGVKSIALCCVSAGVFGYPAEKAANIAVSTVCEWLRARKAEYGEYGYDRVIFDVFTKKDDALYKAELVKALE